MKPARERDHFFDKPHNVRRVLRIFYAVCALLFVIDLVYSRHVYHPWGALWGFYALFGFAACVVLVLAAKELRKAVMRDEDYYDE